MGKPNLAFWEGLAFLGFCLLFVFFLYEPLILGKGTFAHDNFYWDYPLFTFFADSLIENRLPLWNPYSHGGEPFYPLVSHVRLLEPLTILTILGGKYFTSNTLILFNWSRILNLFVMLVGVHLLLRRYASTFYCRLLILPVLFLSSLSFSHMQSDGLLFNFQWAPFVAYFCLKLFEDKEYSLRNWLGLGLSIGINFQSYYFSGPITLLFLMMVSFGFLSPARWKELLRQRPQRWKLLFVLLVVIPMGFPTMALMSEVEDYFFPARVLPSNYESGTPLHSSVSIEGTTPNQSQGLFLGYPVIQYSGSPSTVWDYLSSLVYRQKMGNQEANPAWIAPNATYLYLGMVPWALVIFGLFFGEDPRKREWLFLTVLFLFITLGSKGYVHRFLYYLIPTLTLVRHTSHLLLYVQMGLLYFFVLGVNRALAFHRPNQKGLILFFVLFVAQVLLGLYLADGALLFLFRVVVFAFGFFMVFHRLFQVEGLFELRQKVLFSALGILTLWDLVFHVSEVRAVYQKPIPEAAQVSSSLDRSQRALTSAIHLNELNTNPQPIRYAELITKEATLFSPVRFKRQSNDPFETVRSSTRWDSLLLLEGYVRLVNSSIPNDKLKKILRVDKTPYEFLGSGEVKPLKDSPGVLSLEVKANESGTLYRAEGWHSAWVAKVNGVKVPILKAFENFQKLDLPKGTSHVEFTFQPTAFVWAVVAFFLSIFVGLMGMAVGKNV